MYKCYGVIVTYFLNVICICIDLKGDVDFRVERISAYV